MHRKVLIYANGQIYRTLEGDDVEKLQNEALVLQQELIAQGKKDVQVKTVQSING